MHYYFSGYNLQAVRNGPWKLAIAPQNETMGRPALPDANTHEPRLYNLDQEIGEKTNVANAHPEVVAKLTSLAAAMSKEIGGDHPSARRPAGKVENPSFFIPQSREVERQRRRVLKTKTNRNNYAFKIRVTLLLVCINTTSVFEHSRSNIIIV